MRRQFDRVTCSKYKLLRWSWLSLLTLVMPASLLPFLRSWLPSAATQLSEAPLKVDISKISPGQMITVVWQGRPVWILRRTQHMIQALKERSMDLKDASSSSSVQPFAAKNAFRSLREEYFVVFAKCTHLGCIPIMQVNEGIICPCHGSKFDFAGRVLVGAPAGQNLVIPEYRFSEDGLSVMIGQA